MEELGVRGRNNRPLGFIPSVLPGCTARGTVLKAFHHKDVPLAAYAPPSEDKVALGRQPHLMQARRRPPAFTLDVYLPDRHMLAHDFGMARR